MSESLALDPSPLPGERTTKRAAKFGFGAMFKAALESLVSAQTRSIDEALPLTYRYPPI
jgi:hypothetical protein